MPMAILPELFALLLLSNQVNHESAYITEGDVTESLFYSFNIRLVEASRCRTSNSSELFA